MELNNNIHLLKINFEISISPEKKIPRFVNVILVFGNKITLIDTGVKGSEDLIFDYIKKQGRRVTEIDTIILSHSHPDHIGSAAKIKEITNCKVLAHAFETKWIENIEIQNRERPVPGFFNLVDRSVKIDDFIENKQVLKIPDGPTLHCIESPGHSKGSINLWFAEDQILFTADSIPLKDDIPNYYNYHQLMHSLQRIRHNLACQILLTSWTPPISNRQKMKELIDEGEAYLKTIDIAVKENYNAQNQNTMEGCQLTVIRLGLPPFFANPITDRAFRSHLSL